MNISKLLYRLLVLFLVAVLLVSGTVIVKYLTDAIAQKRQYDALAAQVISSRKEAERPEKPVVPSVSVPQESVAESAPTEPVILPEYAALYEENSDLIGWMVIEGTSINYPVMQKPDQTDYYLKRNFKKEPSSSGCLYVRETCDVFTPSDNVTIYGHHMRNGSMFAGLKKFRDQEFWESYQTIIFDTLYEHHSYTVFAVFTTTASIGQGFAYHQFETAADAEEFDSFVSTCKALSLYDTGITPKYGDKMICLSTCEYSQANGRLVVMAVRNCEP